MPIKLKKSKACTQNSNVISNSPPLSFSSSLSLSERKIYEQSKRFPIQDMTQAKEEEKEVQNFQELPHQQHREDDHEEEHTPTSPNASHAQGRSQDF